jgi:putative flavoprotein involved in K+ transport
MAAGGIRLVGRLSAFDGTRARFEPGLAEALTFADHFFDQRLRPLFDTFAERTGLDLPADEVAQFDYTPPEIEVLDLAAEGIGTVLWTTGYRPDLRWLRLPALDETGLPVQQAGRSEVPGLSFLGTPWLVDMGSANLVGIARDAEALLRDVSA